MRDIWISVMYLGFFGVIGFAIYHTNSCLPLFGLMLFPTVKRSKKKEDD
jgi:hypothetical protein